MYAIETENLTKQFKKQTAVNSLDLQVEEGCIYGFLGPNGAGKTTTINMLTGLLKPTEGTIKFFGEPVVFGSQKVFKQIGFLPDVPEFYGWMTAKDFLKFTCDLLDVDKSKQEEKIKETLELVNLSSPKKIKTFSRGMKQRLGIAQALINDPKILFLDEPTSALDPIGRKELIDIIISLKGKTTVFFSTHILNDVERCCDKVLILDKGNKIIENTIEEIKTDFTSPRFNISFSKPEDTNTFINSLDKIDYITSHKVEDDIINIKVSDLEKAQINLPKIIADNNLQLKLFEISQKTLEDIFVKVVNE